MNQHPAGFYADLARAQISKLSAEPAMTASTNSGKMVVASVDVGERNLTTTLPPAPQPAVKSPEVASLDVPQRPSVPAGPTSEEQRAWDKIKDSSNEADYKTFIKKYPTSVLADLAQTHVDAIEQAAKEQAAKEAAARQAAADAQRQAQIAEAKRQAEEAARQKAAQDAALAAAQQAAKAAARAQADAEREAALKRDEEAHQAALAALAEAAKAKQQADAETAKKQAEQAAALAAAQAASQAAEKARLDAQRVAQAQLEAACKNEQGRLTELQAQGSKARDDLKQLQQGLTCERLRPMVVAALNKANALPDVNTPALIRSAQQELARVGCYSGSIDGSLSSPTTDAIQHYQSVRGGKPVTGSVDISDALISDLKKQSARVCPLVCSAGSVADGDKCVAATEDKAAPAVAKRTDAKAAPKKQAAARPAQAAPRHEELEDAPRPAPHAVEQAATSSGHGHGTMIGVGF